MAGSAAEAIRAIAQEFSRIDPVDAEYATDARISVRDNGQVYAGTKYLGRLPDEVVDWMRRYDGGEEVESISFDFAEPGDASFQPLTGGSIDETFARLMGRQGEE